MTQDLNAQDPQEEQDELSEIDQQDAVLMERLRATFTTSAEGRETIDTALREIFPEEFDPQRQAAFQHLAKEWTKNLQERNSPLAAETP